MSETHTEKPHTESKPKGKTKGENSWLTKQYGPLSGWVWAVLAVGTLILIYEMRKRKAAAATTATTGTDSTGTATYQYGTYPSGGYGGSYGGGSGGGYPTGDYPPSYPTGNTTGTASAGNGLNVIVADEIDKQIAQAQGITADHLFYAGSDPYADKASQDPGYAPSAELPMYNGQPNAVWLGLAGKVAPPGSTVVAGANRQQTAQQLAAVLKAASGTGANNGS